MEDVLLKIEKLQHKIAEIITHNKKIVDENEMLKMELEEEKSNHANAISDVQKHLSSIETLNIKLKEQEQNFNTQKSSSEEIKQKIDACISELNAIIAIEIPA